MQQIVNFIIRNKSFLLFLFLFLVSLGFTIQSHSFHKSKFVNSANFLTGGIYTMSNNFSDYFGLKQQNILLQEENNTLKSLLYNSKNAKDSVFIDSTRFNKTYRFISGQVIRNSYSKTNNVILINKGKTDSLEQDFGVITSKGILGIVEKTSAHNATVLSILNTTTRISAQLKKTNHFGTISWNAKSPQYIQLTEIPQIAPVIIGDTIITSGRSAIFPKGVPVGTVAKFNLDTAENYYEITVKLFNDMTDLEHVYIIENTNKNTLKTLLNNRDD